MNLTQITCNLNGHVCLTVDVTVYHRGFHGDLNETLFVGKVSEEAKKLVNVTWECLEKAIETGKLITCSFAF
jgi:methionyl aminopeptidase